MFVKIPTGLINLDHICGIELKGNAILFDAVDYDSEIDSMYKAVYDNTEQAEKKYNYLCNCILQNKSFCSLIVPKKAG